MLKSWLTRMPVVFALTVIFGCDSGSDTDGVSDPDTVASGGQTSQPFGGAGPSNAQNDQQPGTPDDPSSIAADDMSDGTTPTADENDVDPGLGGQSSSASGESMNDPRPRIEPKLCAQDNETPAAEINFTVDDCPENHFYVPDPLCDTSSGDGRCPFVCRARVADCNACDNNHFCLERITFISNVPGVYCHPKADTGERCVVLTNLGSLYKDNEPACNGTDICAEDATGEPRCMPAKAANAECADTAECDLNLTCRSTDLPNGDAGPYTCQPVDPQVDCYSESECARGFTCDESANRCVPLSQAGEPCEMDGYFASGDGNEAVALIFSKDCSNGLFCLPVGVCGECQSSADCVSGSSCCIQESGESACEDVGIFDACQVPPGRCSPSVD